eukprot:TRINITY_DN30756_c0_g1_i1.p1 TRINITY_DN30756_c0_g1~~TRINITY_DN30756_c0_g1_i1.p1  ORF type:complete len:639 (+),score=99.04 TRINITY_DN30756_c0_g1_i1:116-2032(+)
METGCRPGVASNERHSGCVVDILSHGLVIVKDTAEEGCPSSSQYPHLDATAARYVAPLHAVEPSLLQALRQERAARGPLLAFGWEPLAQITFLVEEAAGCGSGDVAGYACLVQRRAPAESKRTAALPEVGGATAADARSSVGAPDKTEDAASATATAPPAGAAPETPRLSSKRPKNKLKAARARISERLEQLKGDWHRARSNVVLLREAVNALVRDAAGAIEQEDAEALKELLSSAVAAALAFAEHWHASGSSIAGPTELQLLQESRIQEVVAKCLDATNLNSPESLASVLAPLGVLNAAFEARTLGAGGRLDDIAAKVQAALQPLLRVEAVAAKQPRSSGDAGEEAEAAKAGRGSDIGLCSRAGCFSKAERFSVGEGFLCRKHGLTRYLACSVPECNNRRSGGWVAAADQWGAPGQRCRRHGGSRCEVEGCQQTSHRRVPEADAHGGPGNRCFAHAGAFAKRCEVRGCGARPQSKRKFRDMFGPPGWRCGKHNGSRCTAIGCWRSANASVRQRDRHGQPGRRCHVHGGATCTSEGCLLKPVIKVPEADENGPAGYRCGRHRGKQSPRQPRSSTTEKPRRSRKRREEEALPEQGKRCGKAKGSANKPTWHTVKSSSKQQPTRRGIGRKRIPSEEPSRG